MPFCYKVHLLKWVLVIPITVHVHINTLSPEHNSTIGNTVTSPGQVNCKAGLADS